MSKRIRFIFFLSIAACFYNLHSYGQILTPVKWEFTAEKTGVNEYILIFKATIDEGWKVYSKDIAEGGPIGTTLHFESPKSGFELLGNSEELGRREEVVEPLFDNLTVKYYHKKVTLRQKVKITQNVKLSGYVEFQTCNETVCLPPDDIEFSFNLITDNTQTGYVNTNENTNGLLEPVKWNITSEKMNDSMYALLFNAKIEEGWKVYSQHIGSGGPKPAAFNFKADKNYTLVGKVEEMGNLQKHNEPLFKDMLVIYFIHDVTFKQVIKLNADSAVVRGTYEFQTCNESQCMPSEINDFALDVIGGKRIVEIDSAIAALESKDISGEFKIDAVPVQTCGDIVTQPTSLWGAFLKGLAGGLIALFFPCTFPMIPFTINFFVKRGKNKLRGISEASFYGFSIILVYFLASLPFIIFNLPPDSLNAFASNVYVNIFFFIVFILFALSFFGVFEITLPSAWANKADSASNVGGLIGIFFMALTLCVVSFSCTGPILGFLLANNLNTGGYGLSAGMIGFGVGLGVPFALLAIFPQLISNMPKSGGWLGEVKIVFAFIELALAIKFLSTADLVAHWGILKREIFFGSWAILSLLSFLYLIGVIRFSHDSKIKKYSLMRIVFAAVFLFLAVYLGNGVRKGVNPSLTSGFAPPTFYSLYDMESDCPLGLNCFHDFDEAVAYARTVNKPIMIDFTGWSCVNCRKMEDHVWPQDAVFNLISDKYVLVSLYVDDREALATDKQYISEKTGKKIKTTGNKWNDLQITFFNQVSQPYYVLMSPDGKVLNQPVGYTPDKDEYAAFLQCGLDAYKQLAPMAQK